MPDSPLSDPRSAAVPSLTPGPACEEGRAARVQRLARAHVEQRVGTVLGGRWRIERILGSGGMATVFAARHRNGRPVAIKLMRPELALEPSLVERFLREGYVANKIAHPGAVAILDDDVADDGTPFLVMELLSGETLRERLARGTVPVREALAMMGEVADVVAAAHDEGIVHRDLKPDNLFVTDDGAVKVLDFGIARLQDHTRPGLETRSGTTMGTVGFMPPEQARGLTSEVDARTDVWALGATLYALLTGTTVHEATSTNEALLLAMTEPVAPMHALVPWAPSAVRTLLDRALAFDKAARFADARALGAAIAAARRELASMLVAPLPAAAPRTEVAVAPPTPTMLARAFARRGARAATHDDALPTARAVWLGAAAGAAVLVTFALASVVAEPKGRVSELHAAPHHEAARAVRAASTRAREEREAEARLRPAAAPLFSHVAPARAVPEPPAAGSAARAAAKGTKPSTPALATVTPPPPSSEARDPLGSRR